VNHWEYSLPGGKHLQINRALVMGILNVTPDSFSDGGLFIQPEVAVRHAIEMEETGADMIDIGAESTRPGAQVVEVEEEWNRLQPLLHRLATRISIPISVDTYKAEVARRALQEGAGIVNDISGLTFDPDMAGVAAKAGCPVIIMHIRGKPRDMQIDPGYENLMEEVYRFLQQQISFAKSAGIGQLILDPGIGFGKRFEDNFEIIRRLSELKAQGYPVLLGASRKSFLGRLLETEVDRRMMGTAAATALAVNNGANIVRVHDVKEMRQVCSVVTAINSQKI
jgi:dihydropteroate synthase